MSVDSEHRAHDWLAAVTWRPGWSLTLHVAGRDSSLLQATEDAAPYRAHTRTVPAASLADPAVFYQWLTNTIKQIGAHEAAQQLRVAGRMVTGPPNDAINSRELAKAIVDAATLAGNAEHAHNRRAAIHAGAAGMVPDVAGLDVDERLYLTPAEFDQLVAPLTPKNVTPPTETVYGVDEQQDTPTEKDTPEWL